MHYGGIATLLAEKTEKTKTAVIEWPPQSMRPSIFICNTWYQVYITTLTTNGYNTNVSSKPNRGSSNVVRTKEVGVADGERGERSYALFFICFEHMIMPSSKIRETEFDVPGVPGQPAWRPEKRRFERRKL